MFGHTAIKTKEVIDKSIDGLLFIDEAYELSKIESKVDFGAECIATLMKEMEDKRDKFAVVFAGYTNEMNKLLDSNPGFKSRIQFFIDFEDYDSNELINIFKEMALKERYILEKEWEAILNRYFEKLIKIKDEKFGNARMVRNIFEKIKFIQASRIVDSKSKKNYDYIKIGDIEKAIQEENFRVPKINRIGFNFDRELKVV